MPDKRASLGSFGEQIAANYLTRQGYRVEARNWRCVAGEIDLVMRAPDGTLVFVEVRQRASRSHGGAGASIGGVKQRRIIFAARHYIARLASPPPCRFDVVLLEGDETQWLKAAFDASGAA